jgi:hypothetical protein
MKYGANELIGQLGENVVLRVDDTDLSRVQVWTIDGKFIALANANGQVPANATAEELREAIRQKKQARKILTQYTQARPRLHEDLPDLIVRAKSAAAAAAKFDADPTVPPLPPPSLMPVRSAIEGELPSLRRALESRSLRRAVGSELGGSGEERFVYRREASPSPADLDEPAGMSFCEMMAGRPSAAEESP